MSREDLKAFWKRNNMTKEEFLELTGVNNRTLDKYTSAKGNVPKIIVLACEQIDKIRVMKQTIVDLTEKI